jgi:hypothetical protein
VGDIWDTLELESPRGDAADFPPLPSDAGFTPLWLPETGDDAIPQAFADAAAKAKAAAPDDAKAKFPELFSHFENIQSTL